MPDTVPPVIRYRRNLSREFLTIAVLISSNYFRHEIRWFTIVPLPERHLTQFCTGPFPSPFTTTPLREQQRKVV
jgi:hypothetical protein